MESDKDQILDTAATGVEEQKTGEIPPRSSLERLRTQRLDMLTHMSDLKRKVMEIDSEIDKRLEKIDSVLMKKTKKTKVFSHPDSETQYKELRLLL